MSWIVNEMLRNSTWITSSSLNSYSEFYSINPDNENYVEWINDVTYNINSLDTAIVVDGEEELELADISAFYVQNLLDDVYLSLNEILNAAKELYKSKQLSDFSIELIDYIMQGYSYRAIADLTGINHNTIKNKFQNICELIAIYLGGNYTTEGFFDYMVEKYKLDDEQSKKLKEIIG